MSDKYTFTYECKPTEANIYYVFQRLVLPVIISTEYVPYKKYWNEYNELLLIIKKWINIYFNCKDLSKIDIKELDKVDSIISNLKINCLEINTRYIEEIDIWHEEFLEILMKFEGDNKNVKGK